MIKPIVSALLVLALAACDGAPTIPSDADLEVEESVTGRILCDPEGTGDFRLNAWVTIHSSTKSAREIAARVNNRSDENIGCVLLFDASDVE